MNVDTDLAHFSSFKRKKLDEIAMTSGCSGTHVLTSETVGRHAQNKLTKATTTIFYKQ